MISRALRQLPEGGEHTLVFLFSNPGPVRYPASSADSSIQQVMQTGQWRGSTHSLGFTFMNVLLPLAHFFSELCLHISSLVYLDWSCTLIIIGMDNSK